LQTPLNVTPYAAIGFWLYGDGKGEVFKLQLRDAAGGWQDMVTPVNFTGWRYRQFDLSAPTLKDPTRIVSLNLYYNGIPAKSTVTCCIDEIRLLPPLRPLRNPELTVDAQTIRFPVELRAGDRLVLESTGRCLLHNAAGQVQSVTPTGHLSQMGPGAHTVRLTLPQDPRRKFRGTVSLGLVYR